MESPFDSTLSENALDFGLIDESAAGALGVLSGPIRLQHGFEGPKGYGNRHVEAYPRRIKQMQGLGYSTFAAFAEDVCQHYQKIGAGENGRLILIYRKSGYDLRVIVARREEGGETFWNIVTGLPSLVARCEILYEVTRTGGSEPSPGVAVKRPRLATLSLPKLLKSGDSGS